jgi:hypothetical protein
VQKPLNKILHCCEISRLKDLYLYAFFLRLALNPDATTTYLTNEQQSDWVDRVFLPGLYAKHNSEDGLLQHFPALYNAAKATALSYSTKQSSCNYSSTYPASN